MSGDLLVPSPVVKTTITAVRAAIKQGMTRCRVNFVSGTHWTFDIAAVLDDGMIGARTELPEKAAIVMFANVEAIEFE